MSQKEIASAAKAEGNAALSKGDFSAAIAAYTRAIAADPTDHVFYSNRSAAYLSSGDAEAALADSDECIKLKPTWGKGHGRKGAALFKLGSLEAAASAYKEGIKVERTDALEEGLQEVENAMVARANRGKGGGGGGGFPGGMNLFGSDVIARMAADEKMAPYLQDKELMAKAMALSSNPQSLMAALQGGGGDKRLVEVIMFALGGGRRRGEGEGEEDDFGGEEEEDGMYGAGGSGAAGGGGGSSSSSSSGSAPKPSASSSTYTRAPPAPLVPKEAPPPETPEETAARVDREERHAKAQGIKEQGNAAYKGRRFEEALGHYRSAAALDPLDITYLLNEASVHFEEKRWEECVAVCLGAVDKGREVQASFKDIAKAYARAGNARSAGGDLDAAIALYEKAQLEHRTDEVTQRLKKAKVELKAAKEKAYLNPTLGAEAKERGNAAFKEGRFPEAIKEYGEAIARDPGNATYYQNRATAYAKVMNYGPAMEDCDRALKIDPKFVKALNRKGNCQLGIKEYHKALETFRAALALEPDNADSREGLRMTNNRIAEGSRGSGDGKMDEERSRRAMEDPDIQAIMRDPMVNAALEDLQRDQTSASRVMRDPVMGPKIEKLIAAGVLRIG